MKYHLISIQLVFLAQTISAMNVFDVFKYTLDATEPEILSALENFKFGGGVSELPGIQNLTCMATHCVKPLVACIGDFDCR